MSEVRRFEMETDYSIKMRERVAELEADVERYRFMAASGARDFEIQRERIAELEAENAELQKQVDREYAMRKELGKQYLRAVELLRKARQRITSPVIFEDIKAFLTEMEGPGNENPCPKCGRYHLTECEEDTHE
jgi:DNA repair exonuclease SbcCD ATPase subunit